MYIYIFEDGTVKYKQSGEPSLGDLHACDGGVLEIIDVENMRTYYETEWIPLEEIKA